MGLLSGDCPKCWEIPCCCGHEYRRQKLESFFDTFCAVATVAQERFSKYEELGRFLEQPIGSFDFSKYKEINGMMPVGPDMFERLRRIHSEKEANGNTIE